MDDKRKIALLEATIWSLENDRKAHALAAAESREECERLRLELDRTKAALFACRTGPVLVKDDG